MSALSDVCSGIAGLPFQLAYRFLTMPTVRQLVSYELGIAKYGGACADKTLLLRSVLQSLRVKAEVILGGFGAENRLDNEKLELALAEYPDTETYPHMYHCALLVHLEDSVVIAESSGGRIGSFVFDEQQTTALLNQRSCLSCPNISRPLFYHRFPSPLAELVFQNKLTNARLISAMIQRVGIAVAGRWTLRVKQSNHFDQCAETSGKTRPNEFYFLHASEVASHPFCNLFPPECIALLFRAGDVLLKNRASDLRNPITYCLEESPAEWGKGSKLV
jgi:hypothetical protein